MKPRILQLFLLICSYPAHAQHTVKLRNLWSRPQVHVVFNEYVISFTVRDINKALKIMRESLDSNQSPTCGLDTAGNYFYELLPGVRTEYHHTMQPVLQNMVGPFLLNNGHALVENKKHKVLKEITVDIGQPASGGLEMYATFYDPKTRTMLFSGKLNVDMYKKDLGIDDD